MLQFTLGVVWLGPLRHGLVIAGSSVVNAAPATFADAVGTRNGKDANAATSGTNLIAVRRWRRAPLGSLLFMLLLPLVRMCAGRCEDDFRSLLEPTCRSPLLSPSRKDSCHRHGGSRPSVGPSRSFQQTAIARFAVYNRCCMRCSHRTTRDH